MLGHRMNSGYLARCLNIVIHLSHNIRNSAIELATKQEEQRQLLFKVLEYHVTVPGGHCWRCGASTSCKSKARCPRRDTAGKRLERGYLGRLRRTFALLLTNP